MDKLLGETPFLDLASAAAPLPYGGGTAAAPWRYLLSFIGSVRFHTPCLGVADPTQPEPQPQAQPEP